MDSGGHWPRCFPEMPVDDGLVKRAAEVSIMLFSQSGRSSERIGKMHLLREAFILTMMKRIFFLFLQSILRKQLFFLYRQCD